MNKEKTLILIEEDSTSLLLNELKKNNYNVSYFFKSVNKPLRALRRVWIYNRLLKSEMWFGDWFNDLDKYETIIININKLTRNVLDVVSNKNKKARIIGWYWNTVDDLNKPISFNNNIEYWSFDQNDCDKYKFKKNIQFYFSNDNKKVEKDIDVYFIGRDKNRANEINKIKRMMEEKGIGCYFDIIKNDNDIISYEDVKKNLERSKAVLEINKRGQEGFTLRTLESLFFGIKLITNNRSILDSNIYNANNVFVLDVDNNNKLKEFINSSFDHSVDVYKKDYDVNAWFNNFDNV